MNYGHTQEPWVDFKMDSESGYVHGVRSGPGLICAMPGWSIYAYLRAQQVANHKLILSAPDLLIELDQLKVVNAELLAACKALVEYDNSATFAKYEIANTKCRAALASATKGGA